MRDGASETAPRILRLEPADGVSGVFRDSTVLVRVSVPVDPASVSGAGFHVEDPDGRVPGRVSVSPDGLLLVWQPDDSMKPGVPHFVVIEGLQDAAGRLFPRHLSRFVTGWLLWEDLSG